MNRAELLQAPTRQLPPDSLARVGVFMSDSEILADLRRIRDLFCIEADRSPDLHLIIVSGNRRDDVVRNWPLISPHGAVIVNHSGVLLPEDGEGPTSVALYFSYNSSTCGTRLYDSFVNLANAAVTALQKIEGKGVVYGGSRDWDLLTRIFSLEAKGDVHALRADRYQRMRYSAAPTSHCRIQVSDHRIPFANHRSGNDFVKERGLEPSFEHRFYAQLGVDVFRAAELYLTHFLLLESLSVSGQALALYKYLRKSDAHACHGGHILRSYPPDELQSRIDKFSAVWRRRCESVCSQTRELIEPLFAWRETFAKTNGIGPGGSALVSDSIVQRFHDGVNELMEAGSAIPRAERARDVEELEEKLSRIGESLQERMDFVGNRPPWAAQPQDLQVATSVKTPIGKEAAQWRPAKWFVDKGWVANGSRLTKLAKTHPNIRRGASDEDRAQWENPKLLHVYDEVKVYSLTEGKGDTLSRK